MQMYRYSRANARRNEDEAMTNKEGPGDRTSGTENATAGRARAMGGAAEPSTSFSARGAALFRLSSGVGEMLPAVGCMHACSERPADGAALPPMRGCYAACPQAPASPAAGWAGRPLMRRLRIRPNGRTRARSATTEVAPTDARHTTFPVPSRPPMNRRAGR